MLSYGAHVFIRQPAKERGNALEKVLHNTSLPLTTEGVEESAVKCHNRFGNACRHWNN